MTGIILYQIYEKRNNLSMRMYQTSNQKCLSPLNVFSSEYLFKYLKPPEDIESFNEEKLMEKFVDVYCNVHSMIFYDNSKDIWFYWVDDTLNEPYDRRMYLFFVSNVF